MFLAKEKKEKKERQDTQRPKQMSGVCLKEKGKIYTLGQINWQTGKAKNKQTDKLLQKMTVQKEKTRNQNKSKQTETKTA